MSEAVQRQIDRQYVQEALRATVRLYGRVVGHGSHAQVTEGFADVLRDAGLLAGIVAFDRDLPPDSPQPGGALASRAVFTGPLGYLPSMKRGVRHAERYAMLAPNSSFVPGNLLLMLEGICTEILVPSKWARDVVEELTSMPVRVVPHGVGRGFAPIPTLRAKTLAAYRNGEFNVVHFSSSAHERKGTYALLEAWAMLTARGELPPDAQLRLVLDMEALSKTMAWIAERTGQGASFGTVKLVSRIDAAPVRLAEFYATHHVVCQPSRGEGFGLCPLEALASGVPIVATACAGHSEWFLPTLPGIRVDHGPDAPIDDGPGALAPTVEPDAIAAALRRAYSQWEALSDAAAAAAPAVGAEWAWGRQLAPFVEHLKTEREPEETTTT